MATLHLSARSSHCLGLVYRYVQPNLAQGGAGTSTLLESAILCVAGTWTPTRLWCWGPDCTPPT